MFFAALTFRSWTDPHSPQVHALIPRPAIPLGPLRESHAEQVWVENASLTSANVAPAKSHLYRSIVRKADQPASSTDLARGVFTSAEALTLPTKIVSYSRTRRVENCCSESFRRFAILAWSARTRFFLPARCAMASLAPSLVAPRVNSAKSSPERNRRS